MKKKERKENVFKEISQNYKFILKYKVVYNKIVKSTQVSYWYILDFTQLS